VSVAKLVGFERFTCTKVDENPESKDLDAAFLGALRASLQKNLAVTAKLAKELLQQAFINQVTGANDWESTEWVHPELDSIEVGQALWSYGGRQLANDTGKPSQVLAKTLTNLTLVQAGKCDTSTAEADLAQSNEQYRNNFKLAQRLAQTASK
jgi:hypothetical protein